MSHGLSAHSTVSPLWCSFIYCDAAESPRVRLDGHGISVVTTDEVTTGGVASSQLSRHKVTVRHSVLPAISCYKSAP